MNAAVMSNEELLETIRLAASGDDKATSELFKMFESYLNKAARKATKSFGNLLQCGDHLSECYIGMIDALADFDPTKHPSDNMHYKFMSWVGRKAFARCQLATLAMMGPSKYLRRVHGIEEVSLAAPVKHNTDGSDMFVENVIECANGTRETNRREASISLGWLTAKWSKGDIELMEKVAEEGITGAAEMLGMDKVAVITRSKKIVTRTLRQAGRYE
jgi:hypothetical protein